MARLKRGLGALEKWITVGCILTGSLFMLNGPCSAQETSTLPPNCDDAPSDNVDSMASVVMSRTTATGKVDVNRTFAFYMCRAPGFVFNFGVEFPLVNQFAIWCEDRRPGVWLPSDQVPRCMPERVKLSTVASPSKEDMKFMATLYLYNFAAKSALPFLDINKDNGTFGNMGLSRVRNAFKNLEEKVGTSNPDNLGPAIQDVSKNIYSGKGANLQYGDLLNSAAQAQIANDPNSAASTGNLYGQTSDAKKKKITGTIGALIGAGVFITVFMACTIMSRIRGFKRS